MSLPLRTPRVLQAERRLADAYARRPGMPVPVVDPDAGYRRLYSFREMFGDLDKMLAHASGWAQALAATDNDWPPFIDTYCGVVMVAEAFGCEIVHTPGADPWARPALADVSGVRKLKPRPYRETPMIRRLFEWVDYAQRKLGTETPFWTMDIQSPFSVAAHVVEPTELLTACITDPQDVHALCAMITDFTIEFMQAHLRQMDCPGFPGRNFPSIPENIGICIADDTPLIMLSPEMYREFALPYNSRLGEAFGGVHLHGCGDYRHNLDQALLIRNVRSVQVHGGPGEFPLPETTEEDCAFNRARRSVTVFVDTNEVARGDTYRGRPAQHYAEYTLPRLLNGPTTGLIVQSCGTGRDMPEAGAALKWTRERIRAAGSES